MFFLYKVSEIFALRIRNLITLFSHVTGLEGRITGSGVEGRVLLMNEE